MYADDSGSRILDDWNFAKSVLVPPHTRLTKEKLLAGCSINPWALWKL